mmetsp:Transcript_12501/g.20047  ORF Transcript_12501/g.20047 Transcript_12501/m.20047 type:complete len:88 (+) Transcript_12501:962-1225(+)
MKGLCEWRVPTAGMFFWFKPVASIKSVEVVQLLLKNKVLLAPGEFFKANEDNHPSQWLRLSFSFAKNEDLEAGVALISKVLRKLKSN